MPEEKQIQSNLLKLEHELGIPLVATNDSHYLCEDDAHAQDVMVCIQTGKSINDTNRLKFANNQFFVKSPAEMAKVFSGYERVLARTMEIAERCNVELKKVREPFPKFDVPAGYSLDNYFEHISREGFARRLTLLRELQTLGRLKHPLEDYEARLAREIGIIRQMQFAGYFLIVWDFIRYAKENNIPVGPGRGSAAGALVAYALGITDIDPLQNELLFERFLNPERVTMPDIDIDFCMNRRGEVINYVTQKYGRDQVAQIITFGTMAAKAAIKDSGRAMEVPYAEVERITKMVPATLNITIDGALKDSPPLATAYQSEPQTKELIDTAKKLEGLVRNSGVHAAGVVISPQPLTDLVPLYRTKNDEIVTAYDMKAVEKLGLLKMDFLGLTTLTIIDDALRLIEQTRGERLNLDRLELDDQTTYERVFHTGLTSGVFQFESHGMRDVLRRYKPTDRRRPHGVERALSPGPDPGRHDRRLHRSQARPQEDRIRTAAARSRAEGDARRHRLPGAGDADRQPAGRITPSVKPTCLRRAMGKKDPEKMAKQRERFVHGAVERGFPPKKIEKIFDLMEQFAGYGFNKSHSAAYALLAYQTAYLKTHYPIEFMAALLTSVSSSTDDVVKYINECREMGIAVEPPDVNVSDWSFTPHGEAIRFGLGAVKNVGQHAIDSIVAARKEIGSFTSIFQFCEKVDLRLLNKRVMESLIKSGAMDQLGRRAQLMAVVDSAMEHAAKTQRDSAMGQHGLFGVFADEDSQAKEKPLPNIPDWDEHQRLACEKEILGFFITGHPLEKYRDKLLDFHALTTAEVGELKSSTGKDDTLVGGVLKGIRIAKSKKGDLYATGQLEDMNGSVDILCFAEAFRRLGDKLKLDVPVLVKGGVKVEEGSNTKILVGDITPLEQATPRLPRSLRIKIPLENVSENTVSGLHALCQERKGEAKVLFDLERKGDFTVVMEAEGYNVLPDRNFISRVEELCGRGSVRVID